MTDHRLSHRPLDDGDPLHALGTVGVLRPDVYEHPEWYGWGDLREVHRVMLSVRGRPDAPVRIYRAVPPGVSVILSGDWVTLTEAYARQHAARTDDPAEDWPVLSAVVAASSVRNGGNDVLEWGYWGPDLAAEVWP